MKHLIIFTIFLTLAACGGGSSSPVTPAQIPTEVSFASSEAYGDGIAIQMGKSVTATVDADFTDGEVIFTDTASGETDTTGACGTASISGTAVSITAPSDWPNAISQCDITFSYDGTEVPATVGSADGMASAELLKSFKSASSNAMRTYIDTSSEVIAAKWSSTNLSQVINNGVDARITKIKDQSKLYACYIGLSGSPLTNTAAYFVTSSDDGQTWSSPVDIGTGVTTRCRIAAKKVGSNNTIALATFGDSLLFSMSTDDGATFSSPRTLAARAGTTPNVDLDENGVAHVVDFHSDAYHLYSCTASSCTEGYSVSVTADNYMPVVTVDGSSVYMLYMDINGSGYNEAYIRKLTYSSGAYTAGNRFTLATETAASGTIDYEGIAILKDGKLIVNWQYATSKEGYVTIINPSTGVMSSVKLDDNVTAQSAVAVSASNNAHLFYYTTNGYYKLYEYSAATDSFTLGAAQLVDLNSIGTDGSAFTGSDGRFYFLYTTENQTQSDPDYYTSGYLSLFKSVLE